jgi:tetratricopeptide (TPR) repeat protein
MKLSLKISATVLMICLSAICFAQEESDYRIIGKVTDSSNKAIPDAKIVLKNKEDGKTIIIKSKTDGTFEQRFIPHAIYSVTAEKEGYNTIKIDTLDLSVLGQEISGEKKEVTKQIDFQLKTPQELEMVDMEKKIADDYKKGVEVFKAQKWDEAIAIMQPLSAKVPDRYGPYLIMAAAYDAKNDVDKAIMYYEKTISLQPDIADAHLYLVANYIKKKDYPKAIEASKKLLELRPSDIESTCVLGNLYNAAGNSAEAEATVKKGIELGGSDATSAVCHRVYADIQLKNGDMKGASTSLKTYLQLRPSAPDKKDIEEMIQALDQSN